MKRYDDITNAILTLLFALTVAFIGLKAAGDISWPWWLVLVPLWGPVAIFLAVVHFVLLWVVILAIVEGVRKGIEAVRRKC